MRDAHHSRNAGSWATRGFPTSKLRTPCSVLAKLSRCAAVIARISGNEVRRLTRMADWIRCGYVATHVGEPTPDVSKTTALGAPTASSTASASSADASFVEANRVGVRSDAPVPLRSYTMTRAIAPSRSRKDAS